MTDIRSPRYEESGDSSQPRDPKIDVSLGDIALFGDGFTTVKSLHDILYLDSTTRVGDVAGRAIFAAKGEDMRLVVERLEGNTVLAVTTEDADGSRAAYAQQFDPNTVGFGPLLLSDNYSELPEKNVAVKALLLTPGELVIDQDGLDLVMAPHMSHLEEGYEPVIKKKFGNDAELEVQAYGTDGDSYRALIVELPKGGGASFLPLRIPGIAAHP